MLLKLKTKTKPKTKRLSEITPREFMAYCRKHLCAMCPLYREELFSKFGTSCLVTFKDIYRGTLPKDPSLDLTPEEYDDAYNEYKDLEVDLTSIL